MPALPLPWSDGVATGQATVVMASTLELRRWRDVPRFLVDAVRLRNDVRRTDGAAGVSLLAEPTRRRFWTLSSWNTDVAMDAWVAGPRHREIMRRYRARMAGSQFVSWPVLPGDPPPDWDDARRRLAAAHAG